MDAIQRLRSRIAGFPGYSDGDDRRHSDSLVRSYLGEALALTRDRIAPMDAPTQARVEEMILRAIFMNQAAFKIFEHAVLDGARVDAIAGADNALLDLADRAPQIEATGLAAYLDEADTVFNARDKAMAG